MRVLLLGSTGFIGSFLNGGLERAGHTVFKTRVDVRNIEHLRTAVKDVGPEVVINATGITGKPNVDWCDSNPVETMGVNVTGSLNVASICSDTNTYMVQLASGCIYDGFKQGGYTEEDPPNYFGSLYSRSRFLSEMALKDFPNVLHLRIRIPLLGRPHPKNLIDKMLLYSKMINRVNSCTVIEDFVPATIKLIGMRATGLFNMTNPGDACHAEIMYRYSSIVDSSFRMNFMCRDEEVALCARRSNCTLNTNKRESLGVRMRPLHEALEEVMMQYKENAR